MLRQAFTLLIVSLVVGSSFGTPPNVHGNPRSATVGEGVPVTFYGGASPGSTYQWLYNGSPIPNATNTSLTITNAAYRDAGEYILLAANSAGSTNTAPATLTVIPPVQLRHVTNVLMPGGGWPFWVRVVDNLAYVADARVQIYDVTDPASPVHISTYGNSNSRIYGLFVTNNLVYATDGSWLEIINVANPSQPVRVSRTVLMRNGTDVVVRSNIAYVASLAGLELFDVSAPSTPRRLGEYRPGSNVFTLDVLGDAAYLGATGGGVHVVDVSDPLNPKLQQTFRVGISVHTDSVKVTGNRLYAAGTTFSTYDVSEPLNVQPIGTPREVPLTFANGITARGEFLFTSDRSGTISPRPHFSVFDLSNPHRFAEVARVNISSNNVVESFDLVKNHLYLTVGRYLSIYEWERSTNNPVVIQPIGDVLAVAGGTAKLYAESSGGEELKYEWFKEGFAEPIPGATNWALVFPSVTQNDAGKYFVRASNSFGTVTNAGSLRITTASTFNPEIEPRYSRGPRLNFSLQAGLQTRVEASSDLVTWTTLWETQSGSVTNAVDTAGQGANRRFYRLQYGLK